MSLNHIYTKYMEIFNQVPDYMSFAPGRVNLIGEHTDYTGGMVFPAALDIGTYALAKKRKDDEFHVYSLNYPENGLVTFSAGDQFSKEDAWANYPKGVVSLLKSKGVDLNAGLDILFYGNIPSGAGLSSSASIELAIAVLLDQVFELKLDRVELIQLCKETENTFIGVQCGVMDQFIIGMGRRNHALLLNTHDLSYSHQPLNLNGFKIVIVNSMIQRSLWDSQYNTRIDEAKRADSLLRKEGIDYIGKLEPQDLTDVSEILNDQSLYLKIKHIITENHRTKLAAERLSQGDLDGFGQLMLQSHQSLKNDFRVSITELDTLVTLMMENGAIGARMTGAGFGGCMVAIVHESLVESCTLEVSKQYETQFGINPEVYVVQTSDGAWAKKVPIELYVQALIEYGIDHNLLMLEDSIYIQNQLCHLLKLDTFENTLENTTLQMGRLNLEWILKGIGQWAISKGIIGPSVDERDQLEASLMGCMLARPSEIIAQFKSKSEKSSEEASNWFYQLCMDANYIQKSRSDQNIRWTQTSEYGDIKITINLSKPEKDPKSIQAALEAPAKSYPKCLLCKENEGYYGRVNHPARKNLRLIPLVLDGEKWFFQYSPYLYYNEHAIIFNEAHVPMEITAKTFNRMLAFVETFPHYFIGSNADLPIVGGSILSHDHYQGGRHEFTMAKARKTRYFTCALFPDVEVAWVHWPMSLIRISGRNWKSLSACAEHIRSTWQSYSDPSVDLLSHTEDLPHNTLTPVARKKDACFEMDLVLRNNRRSQAYPLGIFHPHEEVQPIKRENIGVIEVMGLAILPPRIKSEIEWIEAFIKGEKLESEPLEAIAKHQSMIREIEACELEGNDSVTSLIKAFIGKRFIEGLEHAGVFKRTDEGIQAFLRFMQALNFVEGGCDENQSE